MAKQEDPISQYSVKFKMAILGLLANLVSHPNLVAICLPKNASTVVFMAMMNNVQLGSDGCPSTN